MIEALGFGVFLVGLVLVFGFIGYGIGRLVGRLIFHR